MAFPVSDTITNDPLDRGDDDPDLCRAQLLIYYNLLFDLIGQRGVADGLCDLDGSTLIPAARIPTGLFAVINSDRIYSGRINKEGTTITGGPTGWTVSPQGSTNRIDTDPDNVTLIYHVMLSAEVDGSNNPVHSTIFFGNWNAYFEYHQHTPNGVSGRYSDTTFLVIAF